MVCRTGMRPQRLALTLAAALLAPLAHGQNGYTFVVDGEAVAPRVVSLAGTPDAPATGDLVALGDWWLRLDAAGAYVYRSEPGRIVQQRDGGEIVVGLDAALLVQADAAARRALRGVRIDRWDDDVATALATLDPAVPLAVRCGAVQGPHHALPPLPPAVQFLRIDWDLPRGFRDLSAGESLRELRVLEFTGIDLEHVDVDLRPFRHATHLRHLDLARTKVVDGAGVVRLFRELRTFLGENLHVLDFTWFGDLQELRQLRCAGLAASGGLWLEPPSLQPLMHLPHLTTLALNLEQLDVLPGGGFAELRRLELVGCQVPSTTVDNFRRSHPQCHVVAGVDPTQLEKVLANVDHVTVRTSPAPGAPERQLFASSKADQVRTIANMLRVVPGDSFHCPCDGSPVFVFSQEGKVLAEISLHHSRSVRWRKGPWRSDAMLAPDAAEALVQWLARRGDPGPRAELHGSDGDPQEAGARDSLRGGR